MIQLQGGLKKGSDSLVDIEGGRGGTSRSELQGDLSQESEFFPKVCPDLTAWETGTNSQPSWSLCQYLLFFTQLSLATCLPQTINQNPISCFLEGPLPSGH